jgi:hypothetical protein
MYGRHAEVQNTKPYRSPTANASRYGFGISGINDMRSSHEILIKPDSKESI